MFFANTGRQDVFHDLSRAFFADDGLYPVLLQNGLLQFGQPAGGGYDPVCFDMKRRSNGDAPLVQLDHEEVLMNSRIRVVKEVAPSFRNFVERVIAGDIPKR